MAKKRRQRCLRGVCDPERTQGLRAPAPQGDHVLVSLEGPGVFLGAQVTKQGGATGHTVVPGTKDPGIDIRTHQIRKPYNEGIKHQ